jgi:hypothetical protein
MQSLNLNPFAAHFLRSKNKAEQEVETQVVKNAQGVSQEEMQLYDAASNVYTGYGNTGAGAGFSSMQTAFKMIFSNKIQKISTYKEMSFFPEIVDALNTICDEAITPDEKGEFVKLVINREIPLREEKHIRRVFDYINNDVLKFKTRGWEFFRTWLVESELYLEKILNDKGTKIIGVKMLPAAHTYPIYEGAVIKKYVQTTKRVNSFNNRHLNESEVSFDPDQITYVNYGQYGVNLLDVRGYLEASIRTWNQLKNLEDALIIYRLVRAPERRLWNVEAGRLPPGKAEEFLKQQIARYKKEFSINTDGTIDSQKLFQALTHDYWFIKREGQGTEVTNLQSGINLGEIDDVNYFLRKLYKTLLIPRSRWEDTMNTVASNMAPGEITREEVKFSRFVGRLRNRFKQIFIDLLTTQLRLSNQIDSKYTKASLFDIEFCEENVFAEQKRLQNLRSKFEVFSQYSADVVGEDNPGGKFSKRWAMTKFFGWSEEEYQQNEEWIKEEKAMFEQPEEANAETGEETTDSENPDSTGLGQTKGMASQEGAAEEEPSGEENLPDDNLKGENPGNEGESEIVMP